jgi:hypothetical protein
MLRKRLSVLFAFLSITITLFAQARKPAPPLKISEEAQQCMQCHSSSTPGIVAQWLGSAHAKKSVDCYSCHKAADKDPAAFEHYGLKIAVIVTPNYCARCHKEEAAEFEKSHHSRAAQFIGSLDNMLGEIVEGGPAAMNGCCQCHGSEVKYLSDRPPSRKEKQVGAAVRSRAHKCLSFVPYVYLCLTGSPFKTTAETRRH